MKLLLNKIYRITSNKAIKQANLALKESNVKKENSFWRSLLLLIFWNVDYTINYKHLVHFEFSPNTKAIINLHTNLP